MFGDECRFHAVFLKNLLALIAETTDYSSVMPPWIHTATTRAMVRLLSHAELVGLSNTDESTFRSMFMAEAVSAKSGLRFQTEWKTFDLLVQSDEDSVLIEFKYYLLRQNLKLDGSSGGYKGGAGPKNQAEFWRCVEKLATQPPQGISDRLLILVYEREYARRSRYTYHRSYGDLTINERILEVSEQSIDRLESRVLRIRPAVVSKTAQ